MDFAPGRLGPPAAQVEIKLQDIPEMGYTNADKPDPRGEVLFRGPCCMLGYYNNPEATKVRADAR